MHPPATPQAILTHIRHNGLVAIIRSRLDLDALLEIGDALLAAPVTVLVIAPGSRAPWAAIAELRARFGRNMVIGAGLLSTPEQVTIALAAGAELILTGCYWPYAAERCRAAEVTYLPGVATPAEARKAAQAGVHTALLFPAGHKGLLRLLAVRRAAPTVNFIPVGGVPHAPFGAASVSEQTAPCAAADGPEHAATVGAYAQAGALAVGVRGVLAHGAQWQMAALIRHLRTLRQAWAAAKADVTQKA